MSYEFDQGIIGIIEDDMQVSRGSIKTLAWLLIQDLAAGEGLDEEKVVGAGARIGLSEDETWAVLANTVSQTGKKDLLAVLRNGVLALRIAKRTLENKTETGWDEIEARALDKASKGLAAMRGNGEVEEMVKIASMANKAIRSRSAKGVPLVDGKQEHLRTGNLGVVHLRINNVNMSGIADGESPDKTARVINKLELSDVRELLVTPDAAESSEVSRAPESMEELLGLECIDE